MLVYFYVEKDWYVIVPDLDSHLRVVMVNDYPTFSVAQATSLVVHHLPTVVVAKLSYPQKIEAVLYLLTNGIGRRFVN